MIDQVPHSATHNTAGDQRDIFVTCSISDFVPLTLYRYLPRVTYTRISMRLIARFFRYRSSIWFLVSYRGNTDSIIEIIISTNTRSKPFSITATIKWDTQHAKWDKIWLITYCSSKYLRKVQNSSVKKFSF